MARPERTGRGLGGRFVEAPLEFAREKDDPGAAALDVAPFDERSISVSEDAAYERLETSGVHRTDVYRPEEDVVVLPAHLMTVTGTVALSTTLLATLPTTCSRSSESPLCPT